MIRTPASHGQLPQLLLTFLAPSIPPLRATSRSSTSSFSTSVQQWGRRDRNRNRGVSAIRRTGPRPRQTLSVSKEDLPKPVLDPKKRSKVVGDENHGLWQFFNKERRIMATPEEDHAHGRAWTLEELGRKSWEDLHRLWWVCVKERNRLSTEQHERERLKAGYGEYESEERLKVVKKTQRAIKHVLTERWYAWEDARMAAMDDKSVNLSPAEGENAYDPGLEGGVFDDQLLDDEEDEDLEDGTDEHHRTSPDESPSGEPARLRNNLPSELVGHTSADLPVGIPSRNPTGVGIGDRGDFSKQQTIGSSP